MRFLIVSLLLSVAGVTFSANNDDGNAVVNRYKRMSILAEADTARGTHEEPSSDSDEEGTAEPSSDSDGEGTAEPSSDSDEEGTAEPSSDSDEEDMAKPSSESDEEGTTEPSSESDEEGTTEPSSDSDDEGRAEPLSDSDEEGTAEPSSDSDGEGMAEPSSDSDGEGTTEPSSDSDGEGTAEPSSDSDEEGTTKPSSDSDEESSSDSDKEDAGIKECPCGCPRNFVSPPICMRYWIDSRDHGIIARARNKCVYNCYKCQADRLGFKITPVKPVSTKKCPENTDKGKKLMWCLFKPKCFGGLTGVVRGFSGAHPVSMKREKGGKCFKVPNNCVRDCISKAYKGAYVNC